MNSTLDPSAEPDDYFDEVLAAYLEAVDVGWAPPRQEILARYANYREKWEGFFAAQDRVHASAEPLRPASLYLSVPPGSGSLVGTNPCPGGPIQALPQPPVHETEKLPRIFGDYELLEVVAHGGMGIVYKARQISLNRTVALKMIRSLQLAGTTDVQRFKNEAEAAAQMDHRHIVPVYDVGIREGRPFFSMKLMEGGSLAERIRRGFPAEDVTEKGGTEGVRPLHPSTSAAVRLLIKVARAVHYAHQHGILHRDLKPANILLDAEGEPHVTDFGLAKRIEGDAGLTQSHAIVGTPSYMAPEQTLGKKGGLTTAADVYGLGAIFYELLTGRPPFRNENILDTLLQVREHRPVPPRILNPAVERDLETICLKCLEKVPEQRYRSALDLAEDLQRVESGQPLMARPVSMLERVSKWVRRQPAIAALLAALVLSLLGGSSIAVYFGYQAEMRAQEAEAALRERDEAETRRDAIELSLREAQRLLSRAHAEARELVFQRFLGYLKDNPQATKLDPDKLEAMFLAANPDIRKDIMRELELRAPDLLKDIRQRLKQLRAEGVPAEVFAPAPEAGAILGIAAPNMVGD
jgi:serine/threonine protein kinase